MAARRPPSARLYAGPAKRSRHRGALGYVYEIHSVYVQSMFSLCSVYIHSMFSPHSLYVQSTFSLCSVYVQSKFSLSPGYKFRAHTDFDPYCSEGVALTLTLTLTLTLLL